MHTTNSDRAIAMTEERVAFFLRANCGITREVQAAGCSWFLARPKRSLKGRGPEAVERPRHVPRQTKRGSPSGVLSRRYGVT